MPEPYLFCLLLLVAVYLSVIVHEVGHALAGRAMGFVVTSLGLGTARPFLVLPISRARFYFGLSQPFQGITFAFLPRHDTGWRRLAAYVAGGLVANLVGAALALDLALRLPAGQLAIFGKIFAAVNALMGAYNLIPFDMKVGRAPLHSDGKTLLEILRTGSLTTSPPDVIQTATGFGPLWRSIGDRRMHRLYTLSAASSWLELGAKAKAEALVAEAVAIDGPDPYIDWLEWFIRTNLAIVRGEVAEAKAALAQVERLTAPTSTAGVYLLSLLRASLLQIEGEPGKALAAFEKLSHDPVGKRCPALGLAALTSQLHAACVAGDQEAVVALRARYVSQRSFPSAVGNLRFHGELARFAAARGDDAQHDYRLALQAIAALAAPWRDPADRATFIAVQSELIEAAQRELDAESVASFLQAIETDQPDSPLMSRDKAFRRWSLRVMLINAVSFAPLIYLALAIGRPQGGPAIFLAVLLACFTLLGTLYLLFDFAVGKLLPSLKRLTGFILLALAVTPWFGGLLFGFFAIFMP